VARENIVAARKRTTKIRGGATMVASCVRGLNPVLPSWKMLVFVFLLAVLGTSQILLFVPLTNTVLLLGAPMLPAWWVKISTYLQSERFLSILKLLIIFYALVHNTIVFGYACNFLLGVVRHFSR
jgi:hypothetical protein